MPKLNIEELLSQKVSDDNKKEELKISEELAGIGYESREVFSPFNFEPFTTGGGSRPRIHF